MISGEGASAKKQHLFLAIPARYASTRLPGKMLLKIGTKTLIEHVAHRAQLLVPKLQDALGITASVVVATDNDDIVKTLASVGVQTVMTNADLPSGTDRIYSALKNAKPQQHDLVINIQGDEPFFSHQDILTLAKRMLSQPHLQMGTLAFARCSTEFFLKPSVVKVVTDKQGCALYFSRAPIPWPRAKFGASEAPNHSTLTSVEVDFLHHVGVYAYRWHALEALATQLSQSEAEICEGLEQLRALENGFKIAVVNAAEAPFGIDTQADLDRACQKMGEA